MKTRRKRMLAILIGFALISAMMVMPASATTWDVYSGQSIQSAIDGASSGDTIFVHAGTYHEGALRIMGAAKQSITLKGEGPDKVTLDGGGASDNIGIGGDSMENGASGCVVEGFKMMNSGEGIEIASFAPDCIIRNCVFEGLTATAPLQMSASNTTFENNVNEGSVAGPIFVGGSNVTCRDNIISNTTKTSYAMRLKKCPDSIVVNNTLLNNAGGLGLYEPETTNTTVTRNTIRSGGAGIKLYKAPSDNKIYLNDLIDNTNSVVISGSGTPTNIWNSTKEIEYVYDSYEGEDYLGNYWSDYDFTGKDPDGDGIGNDPYSIPGSTTGDKDYRPLMSGYENYQAPAGPEPTPTPTPGPGPTGVPEFSPLGLIALIGVLSVLLAGTTIGRGKRRQ